MKIQLLFQKVYFKSQEWKDLLVFLEKKKVSAFLLSKNIFLDSYKQVKHNFLGECVIIDFNENEKDFFSQLDDFLSQIKNKFNFKFFLIGFLFNSNSLIYFITIEQLKYYYIFYKSKLNNKSLNGLHSIFLFNLLKELKLKEIANGICQSFLKNNAHTSSNIFSFYY